MVQFTYKLDNREFSTFIGDEATPEEIVDAFIGFMAAVGIDLDGCFDETLN